MAVSGKVVEFSIHEHYTEMKIDGEYGIQLFHIINPYKNMGKLLGEFVWGNSGELYVGTNKIGNRHNYSKVKLLGIYV